MSNPIPKVQNMNHGTASSFLPNAATMDLVKESEKDALFKQLMEFEQAVEKEKKVGERDTHGKLWVGTSQEVIDYHNPKGLGAQSYFIYKDVFVTKKEQVEQVTKDLEKIVLQSGFGDPRVRIVGLT